MRPNHMPLKFLPARRCQLHNRQTRRIGTHHCPLPPILLHLFHHRLFDVQPLDNHLTHPVCLRNHPQVILKISRDDAGGICAVCQWRRLHFYQFLDALFGYGIGLMRILRLPVQQMDLQAGIDAVSRDLASHHPTSQNNYLPDFVDRFHRRRSSCVWYSCVWYL